jgi:hypothetical protein
MMTIMTVMAMMTMMRRITMMMRIHCAQSSPSKAFQQIIITCRGTTPVDHLSVGPLPW